MPWDYQPVHRGLNLFWKIWVPSEDEKKEEKPKRRRRGWKNAENRAIDNADQKAKVETR